MYSLFLMCADQVKAFPKDYAKGGLSIDPSQYRHSFGNPAAALLEGLVYWPDGNGSYNILASHSCSLNSSPLSSLEDLRQVAANLYRLLKSALQDKRTSKRKIVLLAEGDEPALDWDELLRIVRKNNADARLEVMNLEIYSPQKFQKNMSDLWRSLFEIDAIYAIKNGVADFFRLFLPVHIQARAESATTMPHLLFGNSKFPAAEALAASLFKSFVFSSAYEPPVSCIGNLLLRKFAPLFYSSLHSMWQADKGWIKRALIRSTDVWLGQTLSALFGSSLRGRTEGLPRQKRSDTSRPHEQAKKFLDLSGQGAYDQACAIGLALLAGRYRNADFLEALAKAFYQICNFHCAALCASLGSRMFPRWNNGLFFFLAGRYLSLAGESGPALDKFCEYVAADEKGSFNFDRFRVATLLGKHCSPLNWNCAFAIFRLGSMIRGELAQARLLRLAERDEDAIKLLEKNNDQFSVKFMADTYLQMGHIARAEELIHSRLPEISLHTDLHLNLLLAKRSGQALKEMVKHIQEHGLAVKKNSLLVLANFMAGNMADAFRAMGTPELIHVLKKYYPSKFISGPAPGPGRTLVLSEAFLGDEVRYARLFPAIASRFGPCAFVCEKRLYPLFKRSFPELEFIGARKLREAELGKDFTPYNQLPGLDCAFYMDNDCLPAVRKADWIIPLLHAMPHVGDRLDVWKELPYLRTDNALRCLFRRRLEKIASECGCNTIIGLSWRSSLSDKNRDINKFDEEFLNSLLKVRQTLFVNCQCDALNARERDFFSGFSNFVSILELDQFKNLDGAAALYAALDMMISSNTSTADLAGAVGAKVLMPVKNPLTLAFCGAQYPEHLQLSNMNMFYYRGLEDFARFLDHMKELLAYRIKK